MADANDYPESWIHIPPIGDVDFGTKEDMLAFVKFAEPRVAAANVMWKALGKAGIKQYEEARYEAYKQWQAENI